MNKIIRRILKILGWTIGSVILLLVLVIVLIQVPSVQQFVRGKAVAFLEKKIGTKVNIDRLSIAFPKKIVLEGIYFEDQKHDTLLSGKKIELDIAMLALLHKKITVNDVELEGIRANIYRNNPDTAWNYDYIVNAFVKPDTTTKVKDTSGGFTFDVEHVRLQKILVTFKDWESGSDMFVYLGDFETKIKKFDLDKMNFNVPKIRLESLVARIYQHKPMVEAKPVAQVQANAQKPMNLGLDIGDITIKDIAADFKNDVSAFSTQLELGALEIVPEKLDLAKLDIHLKKFLLDNTHAVVTLGKTEAAKVVAQQAAETAQAQASNPWKVVVDNITFSNDHVKFDNDNQPKARTGMDYAHLDIDSLQFDANNLAISPTAYSGDINKLAMSEQCGFHLRQLKTNFLYDDHGAYLKNLLVQTDKTVIRNEIGAAWPSLASLSTHLGDLLLGINLDHSTIAFKDILTFAPQLAVSPGFKGNEGQAININGSVKGYVKDLEIPNLEISAFQHTSLKLSGRMKGLPDAQKAYYNINIAHFATAESDIEKLAPKGSIPPNVRVPETISLEGFFVGGMNAFNTKLDVRTSRGNVDVAGTMRNKQTYDITAATGALDLGYIMKQEGTLGRLTMQASARGTGFDPKTMVAAIQARIVDANAKGYDYRNLVFSANLNRGTIAAKANMHDANLAFALNANAVMKTKFPSIRADLQLDSINLQALHLDTSQLKIHGHIAADLPSTDPDALEGKVRITDLVVLNAGKRLAMHDTIGLDAFAENGGRHIHFFSEVVNADLTGDYKLTQIAPAIQHTIEHYYHLPGYKEAPFTPQQFALTASVTPGPLLYEFVPAMKGTDTINAKISYSSSANDLQMIVLAPKIVFGTSAIDSLKLNASTGDALNYALTLNSAGNTQFKVFQTSLSGNLANNQLTTALDVKDAKNKSQYQLGAQVAEVGNGGYKVALAQGLMLDYTTWTVAGDNFIQYDNAGVVIHNFNISNGAQSISANSAQENAAAPIDVRFQNFQIATITKIATQDSLLADGIINGTAQLRNPTKNLEFTSDINIADLSYKRDTIGTLTVKVDNQTAQTLNANVQLQGHGNDIRLDGKYFLANQNLDLNLNLANINLASMTPFSGGQLASAAGALRGQLAIKGTPSAPSVNGAIRFDSAYVTPTVLGERFALTNDAININASGIHFGTFDIADSAANKMTITGDINIGAGKGIADVSDYKFALGISAKNFTAVNATRSETQQPFFGTLNLTTNTKITGDMNTPVINTFLRINKPTDFSYILPTQDPEVESRIGVVEFVDMEHPNDTAIFAHNADSVANSLKVMGIDMNATIETDSAAKFTVVIDERNGDALHIQGTASLQATLDKSGKTSLTGTYTIEGGSYLLTLSFLKRQFNMQRGSVITWTGDPTSATVDITAIYVANAAPIDLVQDQLTAQSQSELNLYKQRLPFNVFLHIKGELMKPQITFDVDLPERQQNQWRDVENKLAQVRADDAELNKQVFALLLLGHFVQQNPLESAAGGSSIAETFVRQSAASILTDQLNKLAGSLITGVDVTFGVNSGDDYSTGDLTERTDLTVGLSKRLLSDRLRVNVGSSFQVEGPRNNNQAASNIAGDVSLDYQLSKDGRYLVRAYRRNDYEGIIEGQVIETGASFIFTVDYDKFSEFFRKASHKNGKITAATK